MRRILVFQKNFIGRNEANLMERILVIGNNHGAYFSIFGRILVFGAHFSMSRGTNLKKMIGRILV